MNHGHQDKRLKREDNARCKAARRGRARRRRRKAPKSAAPALAKPLSGEDMMKIVELGKGSNSIELKLSVPLSGHRATIKSIGLDPVEAQPRQAFFFDTPDLALSRAGLVVRARRIQGGTRRHGDQAAPGGARPASTRKSAARPPSRSRST